MCVCIHTPFYTHLLCFSSTRLVIGRRGEEEAVREDPIGEVLQVEASGHQPHEAHGLPFACRLAVWLFGLRVRGGAGNGAERHGGPKKKVFQCVPKKENWTYHVHVIYCTFSVLVM